MRISTLIFSILFIGMHSLSCQELSELKLQFTEIDSLNYVELKKEFPSHLIMDSTVKTIPDSSFSLTLKNEEQRFNCENDYRDFYYYRGFLPSIQSFIVTHCSMHSCETFLIDYNTGKRQYLSSPFDNEIETPVISKDGTKIIAFSSDAFSQESYIAIAERKDKSEDFNFQNLKSTFVHPLKIHEVNWIDHSSFALLTFEKYGGKSGNTLLNPKYFIGEIK